MTPRSISRLIVRCAVFVLFLGATTFLVLAAYGYRYDSQENKLEPTGIIAIDGAYRGVNVSLDGTIIARNLPVSISGVREGYHRLEILKDGFMPWSREVQVTNGMVSSIPFVVLLSEKSIQDPKVVLSTKGLFKSPIALLGASSEALLVKDAHTYFYVDLLTKKKTPLLMPKDLENPVFSLGEKVGYGFYKGLLRKFTIDPSQKKFSISDEQAFPYSRDGLSFLQFSSDFKELLFLRGGDIVSVVPGVPADSEKLFTRFAETVKYLRWYYDTKHFVIQVAQKLEFCDDTFTNCYILRELVDADSFAVAKDGVYLYDSKQEKVIFMPIFSGESAFLSYIFSEQVSL